MFHVLFVAPARNDANIGDKIWKGAALETDREEDLHGLQRSQ